MPSSRWVMKVETDGTASRTVNVEAGLTVGRHPDNSCILEDPRVSGFHFCIAKSDDGSLQVEDVGSSNGTRISEEVKLHKGDRHPITEGLSLRIGKTSITFEGAPEIVKTMLGGEGVAKTVLGAPPEPPAKPEGKDKPAPKPKPAEKAKPAPKPAKKDEPDPAAVTSLSSGPVASGSDSDSSLDMSTTGGTVLAGDVGDAMLLAIAEFRTAMARVVVGTEAIRQRHDLTKTDMKIGRSRSAKRQVDIVLEHDAVSSEHARIEFKGGQFYVEDLNSSNGTFIDGAKVSPGTPMRIKSNQEIRFGTVSALFISSVDEAGKPISKDLYGNALRVLSGTKKINELLEKRLRQDLSQSDLHPGEQLVLEGRVSPQDWNKAFKDAPLVDVARVTTGSGGGMGMMILFVLLAIAAGLIYYFFLM